MVAAKVLSNPESMPALPRITTYRCCVLCGMSEQFFPLDGGKRCRACAVEWDGIPSEVEGRARIDRWREREQERNGERWAALRAAAEAGGVGRG